MKNLPLNIKFLVWGTFSFCPYDQSVRSLPLSPICIEDRIIWCFQDGNRTYEWINLSWNIAGVIFGKIESNSRGISLNDQRIIFWTFNPYYRHIWSIIVCYIYLNQKYQWNIRNWWFWSITTRRNHVLNIIFHDIHIS